MIPRVGEPQISAPAEQRRAVETQPTGAASQLVEHFFRHETGRLHGALVRLLGVHNLSLAEDIAQEAMLRALRTWSMGGVPANPSAWIMRVAMNLAKDALRHRNMAAEGNGHHHPRGADDAAAGSRRRKCS